MDNNNDAIIKLFNALQREYIICKLRVKIYPIQKHKDYWLNLANQKKIKIKDISVRNGFLSIFSNYEEELKLEKEIYNKTGLPKFYYPVEKIKEQQRMWDIKNYFCEGSKILYNGSTFTIEKLDLVNETIVINFNKNKVEINFSDVKRIL